QQLQQPMQQQQPSIFGALSNGIASNPLTLMALGAGVMEGGLGKGLKYAMPAAQIDQQNRTITEPERALIKRGLSPDVARVASRNPAIMKGILEQSLGIGGNTDDIKEYQFAKQQ